MFSGAVCWVSSPHSPSHARSRRAAATPSDPRGPRPPAPLPGAARGTDISTPGTVLEHGEPACIGTHHTQRPHRCVRGAFKGAIASACGRASPPRSRPSAAPCLADDQDAVVDAKLLFKSRAERSRPWFAGAHFVSGLRVLVPVVRTRGFDARRSALARSRIADMLAARRHACRVGAGAGRGTLVGDAPFRAARACLRFDRPLSHNPSGLPGLMEDDWG